MRGGANSVQHLLTPAALQILRHAVTEARRRGHPQVQPLHVVAMLLAHAGSRLRQACMLSQPDCSQTPQCRALQVCFTVALDHLAQSGLAATSQPVLSNALMAALKRAHAHQRRGCPEHQQSPLLAVKVEIDQLILSILDDPSVSRVMREAGFSSTNVKFNLEDGSGVGQIGVTQTLSVHEQQGAKLSLDLLSQGRFHGSSCVTQEETETKGSVRFPGDSVNQTHSTSSWQHSDFHTGSFEQRDLIHRTPNLAGNIGGSRIVSQPWEDDIHKILKIFLSSRNRNVILIGESPAETNDVLKHLASRIKNSNVPSALQGLQFLDPQLSSSSFGFCSSLEMEQKLAELGKIVGECMPAGAILHIGDLQWLAEPMQLKKGPSNFCPAHHTATELGRLLVRHANERLWFVGLATPQIFTQLQARHPALKADWGLQPVQIGAAMQSYSLNRFSSSPRPAEDGETAKPMWAMCGISPQVIPMGVESGSVGDDEGEEEIQCCPECLAKFEEERRFVHEHERLALQLAPAEWFSLTSDGVYSSGKSQVKNQSVIQKLLKLRRKWQATCRKLHMHTFMPVPTHSRPELLSLSRLSVVPHGMDCKPSGLNPEKFGPWAGPDNNTLSLSNSDRLTQTPSSFLDYTLSSSGVRGVSPLASMVQVQDAVSLGANGILEAQCGPDIGSPKDGSSVASGPDDQEDLHSPTRTSVQDAFLAPLDTDLALGRVVDTIHCSSVAATPRSHIKAFADHPSCHSLSGMRNSGNPPWLMQSTMQKDLVGAVISTDNTSPPRLPWQPALNLPSKVQPWVSSVIESNRPSGGKDCLTNNLKGLCKGLMERVPWQGAAVEAIAETVLKCRVGVGATRGTMSKTGTWILLMGPDRFAKLAIAKALAKHVFGDESSFLCLGFTGGCAAKMEVDAGGSRYRGPPTLDRLVEAVRLKPSSVILLEDIDCADNVIRNKVIRAMDRGKLAGSNGREVSFSNAIVLMTTNIGVVSSSLEHKSDDLCFSEEKLVAMKQSSIRILVEDTHTEKVIFKGQNNIRVVDNQGGKHHDVVNIVNPVAEVPCWVPKRKSQALLHCDFNSSSGEKRRKSSDRQLLCLDLNLALGENKVDCWPSEGTQSSWTDGRINKELDEVAKHEKALSGTLSNKFCALLDSIVVLNPYDFKGLAMEILQKFGKSFENLISRGVDLEIDLHLLEHMVSCVWKMPDGRQEFDFWIDAFFKSLTRAFMDIPICDKRVIKIVAESDHSSEDNNGFEEEVSLPHAILFGSTQVLTLHLTGEAKVQHMDGGQVVPGGH